MRALYILLFTTSALGLLYFLFGKKLIQLYFFSAQAELDTKLSTELVNNQLVITAQVTIKNPSEHAINVRQPFIRLFTRPKAQRLPNEAPLVSSNLTGTQHIIPAFGSKKLDPIVLKISALSATKLIRQFISSKQVALHAATTLNTNGVFTTKEVAITPKSLLA